ncbi:MAG: AarF/ABC1/UbiB kinase family protein [bacterium]
MNLSETYSNLERVRQIVNVLIKHGFGQAVSFLNLDKYLSFGKRIFGLKIEKLPEKEINLTPAERLTLVFEELGPTFIKFGQIMSTRPDLLPQDFIEAFTRLQDRVKPFDYEEVKKIIEDELGQPVEKIFKSFNKKPAAAASISQVHYAVLNTGEEVVVKVQRPGIQKKILTDIRILYMIANYIEKKLGDDRLFEPLLLVEEFDNSIRREMDFIIEASNTEKLHNNFRNDPDICFSNVWWDYTTSRVLTLERLSGFRLDDEEKFKQYKIDKGKLAEKIIYAYLKQFFEDGFFHADPHMGNILISPEGKILILDCGMVGYLHRELKENFSQVFVGIVTRDFEKIVDAYIKLGMMTQPIDYVSFHKDIVAYMERHLDVPIKQFKISDVFMDTLNNAQKYKIRVNVDFLLLMRSLAILENITRKLKPDMNIIETTKPYAFDLLKKKFSFKDLSSGLLKLIFDLTDTSREFPKQIKQILRKVQTGGLRFEITNPMDKKIEAEIDRLGNKISIGIIIAGLAIASAIVLQNTTAPILFGVPFLTLLGYCGVGFITVFLIVSIISYNKG